MCCPWKDPKHGCGNADCCHYGGGIPNCTRPDKQQGSEAVHPLPPKGGINGARSIPLSPAETLHHKLLDYRITIELRVFTETFLQEVPQDFWTAPASSSGKHHPSFTLGTGGLLRHTMLVMYLANEFSTLFQLNDNDRQLAVVAACLHDTYKGGYTQPWGHTVKDHANLAAVALYEAGLETGLEEDVLQIARAVECHMALWSNEVPIRIRDMDPISQVVAIADYTAARKMIDELEDTFGDSWSLVDWVLGD